MFITLLILFCILFFFILLIKYYHKYNIISYKLFTCFYNDKNKDRQLELEYCVEHNIKNNLINQIFLIIDNKNTIIKKNIKKSNKVKIIYVDKRPTFKKIFEIVNKNTFNENDINIIANTDIYFDDTLLLVNKYLNKDVSFALTRYDIKEDNSIKFFNHRGSQDVWMFRGKINYENMNLDYTQGIPSCDNSLAYEIRKVGYKIYNPSLDIKTYHLHKTNIRNYDNRDIVNNQYLLLDNISLIEIN